MSLPFPDYNTLRVRFTNELRSNSSITGHNSDCTTAWEQTWPTVLAAAVTAAYHTDAKGTIKPRDSIMWTFLLKRYGYA